VPARPKEPISENAERWGGNDGTGEHTKAPIPTRSMIVMPFPRDAVFADR